jgi:pimeloyl-ACP methyl ester carboxylesterase
MLRQVLKPFLMLVWLMCLAAWSHAQALQTVVDVPTRAGVTQRLLVLTPPEPKAVVLLFAGGHGGLRLFANGTWTWGGGNFLIRSRQDFVAQGLTVVIVDAPSDRQTYPFLNGFRQSAEHVADIRVVLSHLRAQSKLPVWLIGTSRGTESAAFLATQLQGAEAPDGIVLTSSIVSDRGHRAIGYYALDRIRVPVLLVHHEQDSCRVCPYSEVPAVLKALVNSPRKQLITVTGGVSQGDPCEAFAHHGYNGQEAEVVQQISQWLLTK